jgi:hypothetical protein
MRLIMISGPYTGRTAEETEDNIEKARLKALEVISKKGRFDWFPITPHLNTGRFEMYDFCMEGIRSDYYYNGYTELVQRCQAILMLPDWKESKGAIEEHSLAKAHNIPIYYDVDSIPEVSYDN